MHAGAPRLAPAAQRCLPPLPAPPGPPAAAQRTQLQRAAKAGAGIQPRTYQDERFSYVAIARRAAAAGGGQQGRAACLHPSLLPLARRLSVLHVQCVQHAVPTWLPPGGVRPPPCRAPRPEAHAPARQPLLAGSLMPSLEDPQDALRIPENLRPRKVRRAALGSWHRGVRGGGEAARRLLAPRRPAPTWRQRPPSCCGAPPPHGASACRRAETALPARCRRAAHAQVPADARPVLLYSDSEGEEGEEGGWAGGAEPSEVEDWWGEERGEADRAAGYERDSSSPAEDSDGAGGGGGSGSGGEDRDETLAAAAAAAAGLDEATRRLLLESIAGGEGEKRWPGRCRGTEGPPSAGHGLWATPCGGHPVTAGPLVPALPGFRGCVA